jgi:hypothetical protein
MSIMSFIEDAGEKLLGAGGSKPIESGPSPTAPSLAQLNTAAGAAIAK